MSKISELKVLITGSNGFIGSALIKELIKEASFDLTALVSSNSKATNFSSSIEIISVDLSKPDFIKDLPQNVDVVIHLAQSKFYREFPQKAIDIFNVNVMSTQLLLNWSINAGVVKFIYASSGNVYKPQNKLLTETDICEPTAYYGYSKYAAESVIKPFGKYFNVVILRVFGVYGPQQTNMTIPNIVKKIRNNEEIILAGGLGLYFTPLFIDDCVSIIKKIVTSPVSLRDQVYNLAGSERVNLGELVQLIATSLDIRPNVKMTNEEPMYLMADGSKLYDEIKTSPKIDIKTGIKKTLEK